MITIRKAIASSLTGSQRSCRISEDGGVGPQHPDRRVLGVHLGNQELEETVALLRTHRGGIFFEILREGPVVLGVGKDNGEVDRLDDLEGEAEVAVLGAVGCDELDGSRIEGDDFPFAFQELVGDSAGEEKYANDEK